MHHKPRRLLLLGTLVAALLAVGAIGVANPPTLTIPDPHPGDLPDPHAQLVPGEAAEPGNGEEVEIPRRDPAIAILSESNAAEVPPDEPRSDFVVARDPSASPLATDRGRALMEGILDEVGGEVDLYMSDDHLQLEVIDVRTDSGLLVGVSIQGLDAVSSPNSFITDEWELTSMAGREIAWWADDGWSVSVGLTTEASQVVIHVNTPALSAERMPAEEGRAVAEAVLSAVLDADGQS